MLTKQLIAIGLAASVLIAATGCGKAAEPSGVAAADGQQFEVNRSRRYKSSRNRQYDRS